MIFYFVGHGTTNRDGRFVFILRSTEQERLDQTAYSARDLADVFRREAPTQRRWLILDCCASARAFVEFQPSRSVFDGLRNEGEQIFPARGTVMFAACSSDAVTLADLGGGSTIFTAALMDVLETGDPRLSALMTLSEVAELTQAAINERAGLQGARPEFLDPDQRKGKISQVPFFPNPALSKTVVATQPVDPRRRVTRQSWTRRGLLAGGAVATVTVVATQQSKISQYISSLTSVPSPLPLPTTSPTSAFHGGFAGFDCSEFPGADRLTWLKNNSNLRWCGYYLAPTPSHASTRWMGHRSGLYAAGWGIAPIYVGQQTMGPGSHSVTGETGSRDGKGAIDLLQREGFQSGTCIYLDLEEAPPFTDPRRDYVNSWIVAVQSGGFQAGVYCSFHFAEDIHKLPGGVRIWAFKAGTVASQVVRGPDFPDGLPSEVGFPGTYIWQVAQNASLEDMRAEMTPLIVDLNTAIRPDPGAP